MTHLRDKLNGTLPLDLTSQIDAPRLIALVFDAIHATPWPRPMVAEEGTPEPILRTVLTYCYANGILSSAEVEAAARHDANTRYLCANDFPTFKEIRQFRRHNIAHLRESVARCLQAAWEILNPGQTMSFLPFVAEADHRLGCAVAADSAAMDI